MESHEVDTAACNPLLISLFAQSTLGLVKDMSTCTWEAPALRLQGLELVTALHLTTLLLPLPLPLGRLPLPLAFPKAALAANCC